MKPEHSMTASAPGTLPSPAEQQTMSPLAAGVASLNQARATGFADKQALQQALACFRHALAQNPYDPRGYVALASLVSLAGNPTLARELCHRALQLEAGCKDAWQLLYNLKTASAEEIPAESAVKLDFDKLSEQSQNTLHQLMQYLMSLSFALDQPILEAGELARLKHACQQLKQGQEQMQRQLALLDSESETAELNQYLHQLELGSQRFALLLQASHSFQRLQARIQQGIEATRARIRQIQLPQGQGQHQTFEVFLEAMMDECDAVADHLDQATEQGYTLAAIKPLYKRWLLDVEELQERLDGLPA